MFKINLQLAIELLLSLAFRAVSGVPWRGGADGSCLKTRILPLVVVVVVVDDDVVVSVVSFKLMLLPGIHFKSSWLKSILYQLLKRLRSP